MARKAVVLLSGGVDSATALAVARGKGHETCALTFDYGQRHKIELEAARRVARFLGATEHLVLELNLRRIGGSALTAGIDVPKNRDARAMAAGIPVTYVPARNTVFLSIALGWAEVLGARDLFIGVNAIDYSGYPDCRPEYLQQFERLASLATKAGAEGAIFRVHAPLVRLTKADIIRKGAALGVDFSLTHSCYDPSESGSPCGACDSCILRRKGFVEAGVRDPAAYPPDTPA
ncbi:MAG: 7-cyano-7-deazaguanine synthase QueC [Nitrospirae bacterium]|nr:7-cyano-7-deazaguanine synthase QueC [Nitrospirota bacterium]